MMEPATVYALDRLPIPSPDFAPLQERARTSLGTALHYRQIDVRDVAGLNKVVAAIADEHGRLDGLIAAAGIQQETPALEYSAEDANRMFEVNVTGAFMTAQAAAKQMIRFDNGGSIVMIASMSGTVANRVSAIPPPSVFFFFPGDFADEDITRASSAPPTTPARPASSSWRATLPPSGARMASASTPSRPATSSPPWSRSCSSSSRSAARTGRRKTCWAG